MFPRRVVPGQVWFVTRRCLERRFLLRPDPEVVRIVEYSLAAAAEVTKVRLHAWVQMSNHLHLLLEDVEGRLPEFLQLAHWLIARAVNRFRGRTGYFFECGAPDCIPIETFEDVIRVAAYIEANPVAAKLVPRATLWPGATSARLAYEESVAIERPRTFFRDEDGDEERYPNDATLTLCSLPHSDGWLPQQLRHKVRKVVRRREAQVAEELQEVGGSFLGAKAVLTQSPWGYPESEDDKPRRAGRYSACDPVVGALLWKRDLRFRIAHTEARKRWMRHKNTRFPHGTYWLRVFAGVECDGPDPFEERVA